MQMTEFFLTTFDREVERSRHALQQFPSGKRDWKPHDKSMPFGYLSDIVATIPSWFAMMITRDELDIAPKDGQSSGRRRARPRMSSWPRWTRRPRRRGPRSGTTDAHRPPRGGCWRATSRPSSPATR
ncbi:MAG: hypothetical protein R2712_10445 [Vicinamibacterales bacterium]